MSRADLGFVPTLMCPGPIGHIVVVREREVLLVDCASGTVLRTFALLDDVSGITLSPSGQYLLVEFRQGRSRVWDVTVGELCIEIEDNYAKVVWVAGDRLALARGAKLEIDAIRDQDLIDIANTRLARALSRDERRVYLPEEECPPAAARSDESGT